ncbi:unnamed protein product [Periconia digitata]|uniref:N(6)-L-threonylcarbamoyladenine synthase n=1 Tax=Periconia digitata TaxID=1303443 RepID=A0A9W4UJ89_9PLEO|nr:unnamed protein product [Periconia digitata]
MRISPSVLHGVRRRPLVPCTSSAHSRSLLTLAIETSCDDTSVAILQLGQHDTSRRTAARLHFHKKITANNSAFNGVHPLVALESHQENLAKLVAEAIEHLPSRTSGVTLHSKQLPDFISVTRGPGMRSNLFTGLDTAKGLAVAWQKPLIGVHHMQAHALTPRLENALDLETTIGLDFHNQQTQDIRSVDVQPEFPFISVLASGGHTLLIHSSALTNHHIMGGTVDIAVGECMDKIARTVLPLETLQGAKTSMYGAVLEEFVFPTGSHDSKDPTCSKTIDSGLSASDYVQLYKTQYAYEVPVNNELALKRNISKWGWSVNQPLTKASGGLKNNTLEMSFTGLTTAVERLVMYKRDSDTHKLTKEKRRIEDVTIEERKDLAEYSMRAAFEHIANRVLLALQQRPAETVVVAGGVASNYYLRYILASTLCARGYGNIKVVFPRPNLCCDNAAMIAWAGMEMYLDGARDNLDIRALRKWPLDQLLSPPKEKTT